MRRTHAPCLPRWPIVLLFFVFAARSTALPAPAPGPISTSGATLDPALYRTIHTAWRDPLPLAELPLRLADLGGGDENSDDGASPMWDEDSVQEYEYDRSRGSGLVAPRPGSGGGWVARWLAMGGEGLVTVHLHSANLTLPHRPAAFPPRLSGPTSLPLSGFIVPYSTLEPRSPASASSATVNLDVSLPTPPSDALASLACTPLPPLTRLPPAPAKPYHIALVERGSCDFARKIMNAQLRGAAAVIVGDSKARASETREEGLERDALITMFSPEDTELITIPAVFVSRASWIRLNELVDGQTDSGRREGKGLWVDIGEGSDDGNTLSSLLSFSLLLPSLFLLATIAVHRFRAARRREADRAPPLVVLSLPERIWTPDIAWEEKSSSDNSPVVSPVDAVRPQNTLCPASPDQPEASSSLPTIPPISPSEVRTPPAVEFPEPLAASPRVLPERIPSKKFNKPRTKSQATAMRYFGKDECAICMDAFVKGDVVRILPCGHVFHKDECDEWLLKWRKLCPTCRADVTLPPGETAPTAGTTMTPVTTREEAELMEREGSWRCRFWRGVDRVRAEVLGQRAGLRLGQPGDGERTPLVGQGERGDREREGVV